MLDREMLEQKLQELPLYQYAFMKTEELTFTERVRYICKTECDRYGTTWACPPAVGTVEECRAKCLAYPNLLMISTVTEVSDIANIEEGLATRPEHEATTYEVAEMLKQQGCEVRVLSTESCAICDKCTYPQGPCRHPHKMFPCVESQGILVTDLFEKYAIEFFGGNIVTWVSLLLYR